MLCHGKTSDKRQLTTDNKVYVVVLLLLLFLLNAIDPGPLDIISFLPRWLTRKSERDSKRRGIEIVGGGGVNCKTILIFFQLPYKFFSFDQKIMLPIKHNRIHIICCSSRSILHRKLYLLSVYVICSQ